MCVREIESCLIYLNGIVATCVLYHCFMLQGAGLQYVIVAFTGHPHLVLLTF